MISGDELLHLAREKLGEILFGATLGLIIRLLLAPPGHWLAALRTGGLAIALGVVFAEPVAVIAERVLDLGGYDLRAAAAAAIAVGGRDVVHLAFARLARARRQERAGDD